MTTEQAAELVLDINDDIRESELREWIRQLSNNRHTETGIDDIDDLFQKMNQLFPNKKADPA